MVNKTRSKETKWSDRAIAHEDVWVIASFYKFFESPYREANYEIFKRGIEAAGVRLAVVEIVAEGMDWTLREEHDADKVLRLKTSSVLWHKERSLNLMAEKLPATCKYIAWFDIDCSLEDNAWPQEAIEKLEVENYAAVQLCSNIEFEAKDGSIGESRLTYVRNVRRLGRDTMQAGGRVEGSPGFCWIMKQKDFQNIGGLYDKAIIGGGDLLVADALCFNKTARLMLSNGDTANPYYQDYKRWKTNTIQKLQHKKPATYLSGNSRHLYHDEKQYRMYNVRHYLLLAEKYSPTLDLSREEKTGLWQLENQSIKDILQTYFWIREQPKSKDLDMIFRAFNAISRHIKKYTDAERAKELERKNSHQTFLPNHATETLSTS